MVDDNSTFGTIHSVGNSLGLISDRQDVIVLLIKVLLILYFSAMAFWFILDSLKSEK